MSHYTYRAFISYNRADAAIAAALAASLTRFARPWFATRAMRVFLDKNSLATDPTLSGAIERGLAKSEWLILVASPASAAAPWVRHEVAWWIAHRDLSKMIIARTDGAIAWGGAAAADFDWAVTTALPPLLQGKFPREPLWADLGPAAATSPKTVSNPVFRDGFLLVAAPIHRVSKDVLWNIEREAQRKRVAFAAAAVLAIVAFAWIGRNQYEVSMDRKENLASIQLGAKAFMVLPSDPQLAARIALAGVALRPSGIAASALRSALARIAGDALPARFEVAAPGAVALAFAPDATRLAILFGDGRVGVLDAATGRALGEFAPSPPGEAQAIAWGAGGRLAVAGGSGLRLWSLEISSGSGGSGSGVAATPVPVPNAPAVYALAFSPDGRQLALGHADGAVTVVVAATGTTAQTLSAHRSAVRALSFAHDGQRLASGAESGEVVLWQVATATPALRFEMPRAVASVDFNREGSSTFAKHMLVVADRGGELRVADADTAAGGAAGPPARFLGLRPEPGGVAARFVTSGRCLVRAGASGRVEVDATLGFEPLFGLGRAGSAPLIAIDLAATRLFALLDAAGTVKVYEQPLCGDAEAVCGFAAPHLTTPMTAQERARWVPADLDLGNTVQTAPGPDCRRLIDRIIPTRPDEPSR